MIEWRGVRYSAGNVARRRRESPQGPRPVHKISEVDRAVGAHPLAQRGTGLSVEANEPAPPKGRLTEIGALADSARAWHRAVDTLRKELGADSNAESLQEGLRGGAFRGVPVLFGSIEWPKSLGKPMAADASAGFRAVSSSRIVGYDTDYGPVYATIYCPVAMWEASGPDPEQYLVRIVTEYNGGPAVGLENANLLAVHFSALGWTGPARAPRRIEPGVGFLMADPSAAPPRVAPAFRVFATGAAGT